MSLNKMDVAKRFAFVAGASAAAALIPTALFHTAFSVQSEDQVAQSIIAQQVEDAADRSVNDQLKHIAGMDLPRRTFNVQAQGTIDMAAIRAEAKEQVKETKEGVHRVSLYGGAAVGLAMLFFSLLASAPRPAKPERDLLP